MKIRDSKNFVPVRKDSKIYYGGHQEWLKEKGLSKFFRDRSCVVTAFTNVYFYLFKKGEVSFEDFNSAQYYFYRKIRPKANGVPTASSLNKRLDIINHQLGLNLRSYILEENFFKKVSLDRKIKFIEEGLSKDSPVILINWLSKEISLTSHHGITITKIEKKAAKNEILASSWARPYRFFLEDFERQLRTYTGLIYFTKE